EARQPTAEMSAEVYGEKDAAYWSKYFDVVVEKDAQGKTVELGGSSVNNLADNQHLFGLADGVSLDKSIFAATYNVFGHIVVHYYPTLVPSFPSVNDVIDTSYLKEVKAEANAPAAVPTYTAEEEDDQVIGRKSWRINFETGSARFTPDAQKTLDELYDQTVVTRTIVETDGHTASDGY